MRRTTERTFGHWCNTDNYYDGHGWASPWVAVRPIRLQRGIDNDCYDSNSPSHLGYTRRRIPGEW